MNAHLDTLKLATRFDAGGFSTDQARVLASALGDAAEVANLATKADLRDFATKTDLRETEARLEGKISGLGLRLDGRISELELRLDGKLSDTKADTLKWMVGAIGFQTVVMIGTVLALARVLKP